MKGSSNKAHRIKKRNVSSFFQRNPYSLSSMTASVFDRGIALTFSSSHRTLEARGATSILEPHLAPYSPLMCVAPSVIFADYHRVIASLKRDQEEVYNDFEEDATSEIVHVDLLREDIRPIERNDASPESDSSGSLTTDVFDEDDEAYHERPSHAIHVHPASDISNTYSGCFQESSHRAIRKARRPRPYTSRRSAGSANDSDATDSSVSSRCTYISPEDGMQCKKINKTPQEGGRHWRSCHLYKEAKEMLTGALPIGQGTAITSKAQLDKVTPHIRCPSCSALITRSDAMRRHLRTNCKA